jgi:hypothetical protein
MATKFPIRASASHPSTQLLDLTIFTERDTTLELPSDLLLVRVISQGKGRFPGADIREAALRDMCERLGPVELLWHQQGTFSSHPPRAADDSVATFKVQGSFSKWLAVKTQEGAQAALQALTNSVRSRPRIAPPGDFPRWEPSAAVSGDLGRGEPEMIKAAGTAFKVGSAGSPRATAPRATDTTAPGLPLTVLERSRNLVLEGVPGTGKSHEITRVSKSGFAQPITTIVMHPAIGYEDMIEGVRPTTGGFESGANLHPKPGANWFYECYGEDATCTSSGSESPFGVRAGQFLLACARACKSPADRFLIVLDEINRCNVPRAFGELLLSIEASKRWHWNEGTKKWEGDSPSVTLPYSGLQFFVPDNLYILGTMNTSDRSVAPLDQALRRRFAFHRLEPMSPADLKRALGDFGASALVGGAIDCWHALNKRLEAELGADMMLGHSYFFDAKRLKEQGGDEAEALRSTWRYSLLPQLFEILHIANRIELAQFDELTRHLGALGLEIESPRATGMHAMLRVKERLSANGAT